MNQLELIGTAYYSAIALGFAFLAIVGLGLMLQVDRYLGRWVAFYIVPAMGLGTALSSALSGRDLKYAFASIDALSSGPQGGTSLLRIVTAGIVGMCAATVIAKLFRRGSEKTQPLPGQILFATFAAFFLCNAIFNAAFGVVPSFSHNSLYLPIAFAAVYQWRNEPIETFVRLAKWMLAAFMIGSLVLAVAKPSLAVQPNYKGWVPGLSIRLWGLGFNPNSIGPLALLLLLLEWMRPSSRLAWRCLIWGVGIAVLVLAQSKTAWVAGFAVSFVVAWYRFGRAPGGGMRIGFALTLIAVMLLFSVPLVFFDLGRIWDRIAATQIGFEVSTLTGRSQIWAAAIDAWQQNLVFGYGPNVWGPEHRAAIGMPFAFSAHNQFLQSLSSAGALGLISLLAYLFVLGVYCSRAANISHGVSTALFLMVLIRCFTEVPLSVGGLLTGDAVTQLILFRLALAGALTNKSKSISREILPERKKFIGGAKILNV